MTTFVLAVLAYLALGVVLTRVVMRHVGVTAFDSDTEVGGLTAWLALFWLPLALLLPLGWVIVASLRVLGRWVR